MTDDDVTTMFRSKLDAVSLLHRLSKTPVRRFVLFSSITGSRVAVARPLHRDSAFLDTFAYARRASGFRQRWSTGDCGNPGQMRHQ